MQYSKVYVGVIVIILGWVGIADFVSESEVALIVDHVIQLIGIVGTLWARYKSTGQPIGVLGFRK